MFTVVLAICLLTADDEPKFITTEGTQKLFDDLIEVTVFEMDSRLNTLFKGDMKPSTLSVRPTKAIIKKDSDWFIYPINHLEIWIYSGEDSLYFYRQDEYDGRLFDGRVFVKMDAARTKINKVPKKVLDRLPDRAKVGFEVADDYYPAFITATGTYKLFDGRLSIKVSEKGEMLHHEFTERFESKGILKGGEEPVFPKLPDMKKNANWFIYPVHASETWIYHGDDDLWIYTQPDFDGKTWNPSNHNFFKITPERCRKTKIPKEVLDRLPEKVKAGLKGE